MIMNCHDDDDCDRDFCPADQITIEVHCESSDDQPGWPTTSNNVSVVRKPQLTKFKVLLFGTVYTVIRYICKYYCLTEI